jgi:hypothetical protein
MLKEAHGVQISMSATDTTNSLLPDGLISKKSSPSTRTLLRFNLKGTGYQMEDKALSQTFEWSLVVTFDRRPRGDDIFMDCSSFCNAFRSPAVEAQKKLVFEKTCFQSTCFGQYVCPDFSTIAGGKWPKGR